MDRKVLDQKFEQVALELGILTEAQERQVSEAVRNAPQPAPPGGKVAMDLGLLDMEVKTAVLMAQSGERMLQALEAAHAPGDDLGASERVGTYNAPDRYSRIGTVAGEDPALYRAQKQWQHAENYAVKRRTPGVTATPEQDASAREMILANAEQSYRFAAAWLKVRATEIQGQNPEQAERMRNAGVKLDVSAQAIFVEARVRFQVPEDSRTTPEQYELSVAEYRQKQKDKGEGKSWVNTTGRGPQGAGSPPL